MPGFFSMEGPGIAEAFENSNDELELSAFPLRGKRRAHIRAPEFNSSGGAIDFSKKDGPGWWPEQRRSVHGERSNLVVVRFPSDAGGYFPFETRREKSLP